MTRKRKIKSDEAQDWHQFCVGYLETVMAACLEMAKNSGIGSAKYYLGEDGRPMPQENQEVMRRRTLYIPAVYNIKHALEIIIKRLTIAAFGEAPDRLHNIGELFEILKDRVDIQKFKKEIRKRILSIPIKNSLTKEDLEKWADEITQSSEVFFSTLEQFVRRYQSLDFLGKMIRNFSIIEDSENTAFRYPDLVNVRINYSDIINGIEDIDVMNLGRDAAHLSSVLESLSVILSYTKMKASIIE